MKKLFFIPLWAFACFCISCNSNSGGLSDTAKKNLEASRGISKCFDTKDFSKLGDYVAADAVDHAGETGDIMGLDNMKSEFAKMAANLENSKSEAVKELADDEYVMSWMHFTGSLKADMMGMKGGEKYDMSAIELTKFKDGKMTEHWTFMQPADMMKMMGSMPPQMPMLDSAMTK